MLVSFSKYNFFYCLYSVPKFVLKFFFTPDLLILSRDFMLVAIVSRFVSVKVSTKQSIFCLLYCTEHGHDGRGNVDKFKTCSIIVVHIPWGEGRGGHLLSTKV